MADIRDHKVNTNQKHLKTLVPHELVTSLILEIYYKLLLHKLLKNC